nr:putative ribonuclease H-like domain-containing protein [Tanacetum cinerariifolium]
MCMALYSPNGVRVPSDVSSSHSSSRHLHSTSYTNHWPPVTWQPRQHRSTQVNGGQRRRSCRRSTTVNAAGHRSTTADHGGDRRSTVAVNDGRRSCRRSTTVNAASHRSTAADHGGDRRSTVAVNDGRRWRTTVDCRWTTVDHHRTAAHINYDEVFTPVARIEAIRLFLAYTSFMRFTVYQMDVKSAFLYGTIDEEVYVMQPLGFQDPEHQVTPKECHLHAVKRIFRYLKGHLKLGLWYPKESPFDLVEYSDSDYGGATQDRKSTNGGCQFLGRRLISWQCKK